MGESLWFGGRHDPGDGVGPGGEVRHDDHCAAVERGRGSKERGTRWYFPVDRAEKTRRTQGSSIFLANQKANLHRPRTVRSVKDLCSHGWTVEVGGRRRDEVGPGSLTLALRGAPVFRKSESVRGGRGLMGRFCHPDGGVRLLPRPPGAEASKRPYSRSSFRGSPLHGSAALRAQNLPKRCSQRNARPRLPCTLQK